MKLKSFGLTLGLLLLFAMPGFRLKEDPEFFRQLRQRMSAYDAKFPEEKIYLQLDKSFYKPGEDIWFNGFVLNSRTHTATPISDVLYVQLIDPKGNVAASRELLIRQGTTSGEFTLPQSASGGIYEIKAFTRWMQNFGDKSNFVKKIQVQKVITPRLLFKFDYLKKAYGPGDEVSAKLEIKDLTNKIAANADVKAIINVAGQRYHETSLRSDDAGIAHIRFSLPDSLTTSDGLLQAIVNYNGTTESISRSIPIVLNKVDLTFYPEGGQTLVGAECRVAFKAVNEFGKGADVHGAIVDESDNEVGLFESFHLGMGAFSFKPKADKQYYAVIKSQAGRNQKFPLPDVSTTGLNLRLENRSAETITWTIHSSENRVAWLTGHSRGTIHHTAELKLSRGENQVIVPLKNFPSGIGVFTLFDEHGRARCERLAFVNADDGLRISLTTDKQKYLPGEDIALTVKTTDSSGKPVPAKVSLSVVDDQLLSFADDRQDHLLSRMMLSSEVRGEIEEPSFYFDSEEPKAAAALDYLLMTQGWRRFTWDNIRGKNPPLAYLPEKITSITGRLTGKDGRPVSEAITLVEMGNLKRVLTIQANADGEFVFVNTDPSIPVMLLASRSTSIHIEKSGQRVTPFGETRFANEVPVPEEVVAAEAKKEEQLQAPYPTEAPAAADLNFSLDSDVAELSEVVVIGYGTTEKKFLTASSVSVYRDELNTLPSLEYALQGRVAGVQVQGPNDAGASTAIRVRGISSLTNLSGPLYVIDGHPVSPALNGNFSLASLINPHEIESIHVLKSPEADALFGSDAANGVIIINTRTHLSWGYLPGRQNPGKYVNTIVSPRKFSPVKQFYQEVKSHKATERNDFRTTVYWNPNVVTNEKGIARIEFRNNDAVSTFRITAEGFSATGSLGREEETYFTQLPFSVDAKLPEYLGFEDELRVPVQVRNETQKTLSATITLTIPESIRLSESHVKIIDIPAQSAETIWYTLTPNGVQGTFPLVILVEADKRRDEVRHQLSIKPAGFPVRLSFSGNEMNRDLLFRIRDAEKGTIKGSFSAYPNILNDLITGVEAIFREPYGCFEQTSSSTFPNVLALQYLQNSGAIEPEIETRAMRYIERGYKRLISFEVKGGGFDWFGKPPAHEALTAYGLLEFVEMKKVYPAVDDEMIRRTRDWLLSRRTGKGTFSQLDGGLDDFSRPSGYVSNAYITWALSETGTKDLENEYRHTLESAWEKKDMYRLALAANIAFNLNRKNDYDKLVHHFEKTVNQKNFNNLVASHSVVRSEGISLTNETVALWAIAMLKSGKQHLPAIKACIDHLISTRSFGKFGSTQATVLSLKALADYASLIRSTAHSGEIVLSVNGEETDQYSYDKGTGKTIELDRFTQHLSDNGNQCLSIRFRNTPEALPYSLNLEWYTKQPQSSKACKVELVTTLASNTVALNETVRLRATLANRTAGGIPMTMAVIGIPAGLSAQPWQLKELQEKGVFDFYEINDGKLFLYYRQLKARESKQINLDLKAELRGAFTGSASSAYLYYTDELKHWENGLSVTVN